MDTGECIKNMIITRKGEHVMFRAFGLGSITDRPGRIKKSDLSNAIATWYPQVDGFSIQSTGDNEYIVKVEGA